MAGSPRPPNPTSSSTPSATRCGTRPSPAAPARCDAGLAPLPHRGRGRGPSRQRWEGEGLWTANTLTRLATLATLSRDAGEGLFFLWLQRLQHRVGAGNLDLAGDLLDIERLYRAVLDQHRITLRAGSEAGSAQVDVEPDRAGEVGADVLGAFRGNVFERPGGYLVANLDRHGMVPPNLVPPRDRTAGRHRKRH